MKHDPGLIAFDVYGTLVDPLAISERLKPLVGEPLAGRLAALWRQKQLEYSFRRALMRDYRSFMVCTAQALKYAVAAFEIDLPDDTQHLLIQHYLDLPSFADTEAALKHLHTSGARLIAFSNGEEAVVRELLTRAGLINQIDDVVSVDSTQSFKPDPAVYRYLSSRVRRPAGQIWLVSSNPFDVIGAKHAGLRTAWLKRTAQAVFDPWGIEPDFTATGMGELAKHLERFT